MKKLKNVIAILLVFVMMLSVIGCGKKDPVVNEGDDTKVTEETKEIEPTKAEPITSEPVEIKFSLMNSAWDVDGWTAMVDAANQKLLQEGSNVSIVINKVAAADWPEYYQKIITEMAAGKAPDIARIANSFMPLVVSKGQAIDITSYVENDLDQTKYFSETFKGANYVDGHYYGLPSGVFYMLAYYNKDLFDAAGLAYPSQDWNKATSFEKTKTIAKTLTTGEGANKTFGFSAGPYMAYMGMYTKSNGGENVFYENGKSALADEKTKEVYRWFDTMLKTDYSMPRPTDTKIMGAFDMFKAGRIGMMIDGTWYQQSMQNDVKNFRVGIAAIPAGTGTAYSSMFVDNFFICKGTKHENEAWIALKALYSEEAFSALAKTGVGGLPINRAALENNIDALIGSNFSAEDKQCFKDGLDHVLGVPYNEFYEQADQKINNTMDEWLLGNITSDEFAEKAAKLVDKEAEKVKK